MKTRLFILLFFISFICIGQKFTIYDNNHKILIRKIKKHKVADKLKKLKYTKDTIYARPVKNPKQKCMYMRIKNRFELMQ